jgi:hypothetical protein
MKLAFVADVHIGNHQYAGGAVVAGVNRRCASILGALETAYKIAAGHDVAALVVLGDLFDTVRPNPQTITKIKDLLESAQMNTVLLMGNHDRNSSIPGDHALGPLRYCEEMGPQVSIEGTPTVRDFGAHFVLMLPFNDAPVTEWFEAAIEKSFDLYKNQGRTIELLAVCVHFGLYDEALAQTTPWVRESKDAADVAWVAAALKKHGIRHLFAGNWHSYQSWSIDGVRLTQVGALVPTGFDNPGLTGYGGLVIFDTRTETYEHKKVPGPRFVKVASIDEWEDLCFDVETHPGVFPEVHVSWTCQPGEGAAALDILTAAIWLRSYRVLPDPHAASVFLTQTASVARRAQTVAELTEQLMQRYNLPDNCRRDVVQGHVLRLLGGAR